MTERPILFSSEMVRAILEGRKTQTRRAGSCQKDHTNELGVSYIGHATKGTVAQATYRAFPDGGTARWALCECPYGIPGDWLWVRETWCVGAPYDKHKPSVLEKFNDSSSRLAVDYAADAERIWPKEDQGKWRPSIFMPRWASRLTLQITGLRVERVQSISEEDAMAEGAPEPTGRPGCYPAPWATGKPGPISYRETFKNLWDSINAKRGLGWDVNPWVWVIEFAKLSNTERSDPATS